MDKTQAIKEIDELIEEGNKLEQTTFNPYTIGPDLVNGGNYKSWQSKILALFQCVLVDNHPFITKVKECKDNTHGNLVACRGVLINTKDYLEKGIISIDKDGGSSSEPVLIELLNHFHAIARQLRIRHDNRDTIVIKDEYDVQDLLHALLYSHFEDLRTEEWTPSYAGKSARMDFLIRDISTVIEVKKTRESLTEKEIGDQLIVDIERYKNHPYCDKLICFVYDPEERINNPKGLIQDLEKAHEGFVRIIIQPLY